MATPHSPHHAALSTSNFLSPRLSVSCCSASGSEPEEDADASDKYVIERSFSDGELAKERRKLKHDLFEEEVAAADGGEGLTTMGQVRASREEEEELFDGGSSNDLRIGKLMADTEIAANAAPIGSNLLPEAPAPPPAGPWTNPYDGTEWPAPVPAQAWPAGPAGPHLQYPVPQGYAYPPVRTWAHAPVVGPMFGGSGGYVPAMPLGAVPGAGPFGPLPMAWQGPSLPERPHRRGHRGRHGKGKKAKGKGASDSQAPSPGKAEAHGEEEGPAPK